MNTHTFWHDPALFHAFWGSSRFGILVLDDNLAVVAYNPWLEVRLPQAPPPPGSALHDLFPSLDPVVLRALHEALHQKQPRVLSSAFHHPLFPLRDPGAEDYLYQTAHIVPLQERAGLAVLIEDITERVRHERSLEARIAQRTSALQEQSRFLRYLTEMVRIALQRMLVSTTLWHTLLDHTQGLFQASDAALILEGPPGTERVVAWRGALGQALAEHLPPDADPSWRREALRRGSPFWVPETQRTVYLPSSVAQALPPRTALVLPLGIEAHPTGCLALGFPPGYPLRGDLLERAQLVADVTGLILGHAALYQRLRAQAEHLETLVHRRTEELEEAFHDLEMLVSSLSHDLRAPLRAMEGFAQALLEDLGDQLPPPGQEYADHIRAAAQRMTALLEDLLTYSRVGQRTITLRPVALEQILHQVLTDLREEITARQAQVHLQRPLPEVESDATLLHQALLNLVSNAIKFVPPERTPRVEIGAQRVATPTPGVQIWVADNGIGIPPEAQERIFHPFERLHGEEHFPGTGLGLAIVRKAVQRLGGTISVTSREGKGSRFVLWLPQEGLML